MYMFDQTCIIDACGLSGRNFQRLPRVFHLRLIHGAADWVRIHGHTPLCSIPGFTPWRGLVISWYVEIKKTILQIAFAAGKSPDF